MRRCNRQTVHGGRGAVQAWQVQEGQCQNGQGLECQAEKSDRLAAVRRCLILAVG